MSLFFLWSNSTLECNMDLASRTWTSLSIFHLKWNTDMVVLCGMDHDTLKNICFETILNSKRMISSDHILPVWMLRAMLYQRANFKAYLKFRLCSGFGSQIHQQTEDDMDHHDTYYPVNNMRWIKFPTNRRVKMYYVQLEIWHLPLRRAPISCRSHHWPCPLVPQLILMQPFLLGNV